MSTGCLLQENVSLASVGLGAGTPRQQPAGSNKLLWDENCWGCQLHVRRTSHILLDFRDHSTTRQAPIVHNRQVCPRGLCSNWLLVPLPVCLRARWSARHRFLLCARRPAGRGPGFGLTFYFYFVSRYRLSDLLTGGLWRLSWTWGWVSSHLTRPLFPKWPTLPPHPYHASPHHPPCQSQCLSVSVLVVTSKCFKA